MKIFVLIMPIIYGKYNKLVLVKTILIASGIAEVDEEIIPFEVKPIKYLFLYPNEQKFLTLQTGINTKFANLKLGLTVRVYLEENLETKLDILKIHVDCYD
jgi:hypothetical protein